MAPKLEGTLWSFWRDGTEVYQRTGGHICSLSQSTSQPEREKFAYRSAGHLELDVLSSTLIAYSHVSTTNHVINQWIKYPEVSVCCDGLLVFVAKPVERLEVLPANVLGTRHRMPHFLFDVWQF
ncbi:hypothetical protein QQF64_028043 [Cirrhinus molitorella]|uniref:Uncharacterized protein n=1 Tax=Cirrhinus molitorella TaxID=172907 RepID=A0ABR3N5U6_9TELE